MSDDNVKSLAEARAERSGDASLWTPLECAKALVRDLETGEINPNVMYVAMYEERPDGKIRYPFLTAGPDVGRLSLAGLLARHAAMLWEEVCDQCSKKR